MVVVCLLMSRGSGMNNCCICYFPTLNRSRLKKFSFIGNREMTGLYRRLEYNDSFSVKSCYYALIQQPNEHNLPANYIDRVQRDNRNINVMLGVDFFMWKETTGSLPTMCRPSAKTCRCKQFMRCYRRPFSCLSRLCTCVFYMERAIWNLMVEVHQLKGQYTIA